MFILIISRGYPQQSSPLRGIFEFDQARALKNAGHKVVFLSVDLRSIRRKRKLGKTYFHQYGVEIFNFSIPIGRVPAWLFLRIGGMMLKSLYRDVIKIYGQPDVVHAHFFDIAAVTSALFGINKIPIVVTEHSSKLIKDFVDRKTNYLCRIAYVNANAVIAVSESLSKRLFQHFNVNSVVVPNIVDLNDFFYNPADHDGFVFISVGNLLHIKGFDLLINAFSRASKPDTRLIIVGDGPKRPYLQKRIDTLKLNRQVSLTGIKSRREISEMMLASDAFVLASRGETFGVAYIEAMAAGLPVIATKCGGPEDFVNERNGMLIDVDDENQLTQAMIRMMSLISRYDKKQISEECAQKFRHEVIVEKLVKIYTGLLQSG